MEAYAYSKGQWQDSDAVLDHVVGQLQREAAILEALRVEARQNLAQLGNPLLNGLAVEVLGDALKDGVVEASGAWRVGSCVGLSLFHGLS